MENNRPLPAVTAGLIALNIAAFVLAELHGSTLETAVLIDCGGAYPPLIARGEYWRLFTSMFLHAGIRHLLNNMLLLYVMGSVLETQTGRVRFLITALGGGLAGNLVHYALQIRSAGSSVSVGASGVVFAVIGGVLYVLLRNRGRVQGLTLRQLLIMLFFALYFGFTSPDVANAAHVGGLAGGFLLTLLLYRRPAEPAEDTTLP